MDLLSVALTTATGNPIAHDNRFVPVITVAPEDDGC